MAVIPGFAAAGLDQDYLGEQWGRWPATRWGRARTSRKARLPDLDANDTAA